MNVWPLMANIAAIILCSFAIVKVERRAGRSPALTESQYRLASFTTIASACGIGGSLGTIVSEIFRAVQL